MSWVRKISWQDGMFIHPHHFQQQDLCWEGLISRYHKASPYVGWGILEFEIEESALLMNKIMVRRCVGILPDGTLFNAPDKDSVPLPIIVPKEYCDKYICIGATLDSRTNPHFSTQEKRDLQFRYITERRQYPDLHSKDSEDKDIDICRLNLNLLLATDDLNGVSYIPVLKIASSAQGIILDEGYIAPTIRAQSSSVLRSYLVKVLSLLSNYVNTNFAFLRVSEAPQYSDRSERWLIFQTVHRYQYLFLLLSKDRYLLPYRLFELMIDLIGGVSAFTTTNVFEMPNLSYDHDNLAASFEPLIVMIEQTFGELSRKKVAKLEFNLIDNLYCAEIPDDLQLLDAELILSVTFKEQFQNQQHLFKHFKIATNSEIKKIIAAQVSGLRYVRLESLSPYVSNEKDTVYLQFVQEGYLWDQVLQQRNLSIYTSFEFEQIRRIALWVIAK